MFQIKIRPFDDRYANPANPAYLIPAAGLELGVYVDVTNRERLFAVSAFLALCVLIAIHYEPSLQIAWPPTLAFVLAGLGGVFLVCARKVTTIRVYIAEHGTCRGSSWHARPLPQA